jgi:hypothetical protein
MAHGKPRDPRKEQQWRHWMHQWQRSGLSVRGFCARHGLALPSFYAWRRTLRQRDTARIRFVPVEVTPEPRPPTITHAATSALELVLDDGRRLSIGPGFDAPTLQRLLALLEEGRP